MLLLSSMFGVKVCRMLLFPTQFTVGVLNATLDLATLVLVGVAAFLGFEVVLAPGMAFDSALLLATLFLQFDCMKNILYKQVDLYND